MYVFYLNKSLQNVHVFSVKRAGTKNGIKRASMKNNKKNLVAVNFQE